MGVSGLLGTGTLTVDANAVFSSASKTKVLKNSAVLIKGTMLVNASRCATNVSDGCTSFYFEKKLTINGTIRVTATDHTLQVGDSIRVFSAASFSGTPTFEFEGDVEWDTSRISEGLLFVKGINTAISDIVTDFTPRNIYDIRGRLVRRNATTTEGLPAGVYVCEGRKFVVKPE